MKKVLSGILVGVTVALLGFNFAAQTMDWAQIREATYGIGDANEAYCTATKINETQLLTAGHCVSVGQILVVWDGKAVVGKAVAVRKNPMSDLALLVIQEGVKGTYIPVASQEALQDEEVVLAGYPLGVGEILTVGHLEGFWYREFTNDVESIYFKFNIQTSPGSFGNSGGGSFVYRWGQGWVLVGVTSGVAMQTDFAPYNHIIYSSSQLEIQKFLADNEGI